MIFDRARPELMVARTTVERVAAKGSPPQLGKRARHGPLRDRQPRLAGASACDWRPPCRNGIVPSLAIPRPGLTVRRAARNELGAVPALQPGEIVTQPTGRLARPNCRVEAMKSAR